MELQPNNSLPVDEEDLDDIFDELFPHLGQVSKMHEVLRVRKAYIAEEKLHASIAKQPVSENDELAVRNEIPANHIKDIDSNFSWKRSQKKNGIKQEKNVSKIADNPLPKPFSANELLPVETSNRLMRSNLPFRFVCLILVIEPYCTIDSDDPQK
jgi:hypothetical protein